MGNEESRQRERMQQEELYRQVALQQAELRALQAATEQSRLEAAQRVREQAQQRVREQAQERVKAAQQQAREQAERHSREQAERHAREQAERHAREQAEQRARLPIPSAPTQTQVEHIYPNLQDVRRESSPHTSSGQRSVGSVDDGFVMVTNSTAFTPTNNKNNYRPSRTGQSRLNPGTSKSGSTAQASAPSVRSNPGTSKSGSTAQASTPSLRDWSESDQDPDFNCPLCGLRFGEQIFQCERGHSACDTCRDRGAACKCGAPLTSTRNLLLQVIVEEREIQCPNGCKMSVALYKMKQHLLQCAQSYLACPVATFGNCSWKGNLGQLMAHFEERHPENRHGDVGKEMLLPSVSRDNRYMHLVSLGPFMFVIHVQVADYTGKVSLVVQLLGPRAEAAKWVYEWHVYNKNEPRRKVQFTDGCRSEDESVRAIFKDDDCAVMPVALAATMVNRESVTYKVYIKREDGSKVDKAPRYRRNAKSATRNKS